jgi:hypothetical protein
MNDDVKRIMSQDRIPETRQKVSVFNVKWALSNVWQLSQEEQAVLKGWLKASTAERVSPNLERGQ